MNEFSFLMKDDKLMGAALEFLFRDILQAKYTFCSESVFAKLVAGFLKFQV